MHNYHLRHACPRVSLHYRTRSLTGEPECRACSNRPSSVWGCWPVSLRLRTRSRSRRCRRRAAQRRRLLPRQSLRRHNPFFRNPAARLSSRRAIIRCPRIGIRTRTTIPTRPRSAPSQARTRPGRMSITRRLRRITHLRAAPIRAPVPVPGPTNPASPGLTTSPLQRFGTRTRRLGRRVSHLSVHAQPMVIRPR